MSFLNSELHLNVPLTDLAVRFSPIKEGYLWSKLLPPKVVNKRSNFIRQISKGQLLRIGDYRVGTGGQVQEIQFKLDTSLQYNCIDYSVQSVLRNTEEMEADEILQYAQEQMYTCMISMNGFVEYITIKQTLRDPATLTQNFALTPAEYWDNYNSQDSDPIEDLKRACLDVFVATTNMPNIIVMHAYVWDRVQRHPRVLARAGVHPTGAGILSVAQMEDILGVEHGTLHITSQQYNTALEDQTPSFRSFIGPDTIVAYVDPASVRNYSLGQSFMFQRASAGGANEIIKDLEAPFVVYEFPDVGLKDPRGATIHRIVGGLDQKVLVPEAGFLIQNCVDKTRTDWYGVQLNN